MAPDAARLIFCVAPAHLVVALSMSNTLLLGSRLEATWAALASYVLGKGTF